MTNAQPSLLGEEPWYTPGVNQDLRWFVTSFANPFPPIDGDVATHVQAGKNTYVYDTHTYHTKVPPAAIAPFIEAHTRPGDIVLDPFCGSGMTGVSARSLGRHVILSDLSPAATFIAYNFLTIVDVRTWDAVTDRLFKRFARLEQALYSAICSKCGSRHRMHYMVWSYRVACPKCQYEFNYWDVGQSIGDSVRTSRLRTEVACPGCAATVRKGALRRLRLEPVQVGHHCPQHRGRQELMRPASEHDIESLERIDRHGVPTGLWYPKDSLPVGVNTRQPIPYGISSIPDFYTTRNLWAMAWLWHEARSCEDARLRHKLLFAVTGLYLRVTKFSEFRFWGGSGNAPRLYVPMVINEQNVFETFARKARHIRDHFSSASFVPESQFCITTQSSTDLGGIPDASIDYVFTDPPFGANINYSEMNFLWESWLGLRTDTREEAIVNAFQGKGAREYEDLLTQVFSECRRVLKPGGAMTVVFNNRSRQIWEAIVGAVINAGFEIRESLILDKRHATAKQLQASNVPGIDVALECRSVGSSVVSTVRARVSTYQDMHDVAADVLVDGGPAAKTDRYVFARCVAALASKGLAPTVDFEAFRSWIRSEFPGMIEEPPLPRYQRELAARRTEKGSRQLALQFDG